MIVGDPRRLKLSPIAAVIGLKALKSLPVNLKCFQDPGDAIGILPFDPSPCDARLRRVELMNGLRFSLSGKPAGFPLIGDASSLYRSGAV